jgi:hypothetical protein
MGIYEVKNTQDNSVFYVYAESEESAVSKAVGAGLSHKVKPGCPEGSPYSPWDYKENISARLLGDLEAKQVDDKNPTFLNPEEKYFEPIK